ncbi:hypothetical protein SEEGA711_17260 [Salmonella enterica subsp. enterica serovar Gaminara str. ATCC BAA-711]|nr:hypothetical protein SEEGA711_17260 [Salmonella enterica subsp. enterica serovar Gaminara str. ATCC BAA-711]
MLYVIYAQDNANSLENASRYGPRIWRACNFCMMKGDY